MLELTGRLPDAIVACVGGGSNAMGIFDAFIDDRGVRLIGVEAGGEAHRAGPARRAVRRRQRRRAAGHADVRAAGRGRQHRADAFDLGRARLRGGRPRARVAAASRAAPSTPTSPTTRRSTAFQTLARLEGILPALESAHAHRARVHGSRASSGRDAILLVNLSGRGDKDVQTVEKQPGDADQRRSDVDVSRIATTFARLRAAGQTGPRHLRHRRRSGPGALGARSCRRSTAPAPTCSRSACRSRIRWPTAR